MNEKIAQEILYEFSSSLEALEAQSSAILQFLKDKGIANDEELTPYLEQAGKASGVRWMAARVRIEHLVSAAFKATEENGKKQPPKIEETNREASAATEKPAAKESGKDSQATQQEAGSGKAKTEKGRVGNEEDQEQEDEEKSRTSENAA